MLKQMDLAPEEPSEPSQPELEILESIGDVCAIFDRQWRYTYINRRGVEMARMSKAELLGRVIWDVYPDLEGGAFHQAALEAMRTRAATHFEQAYEKFGIWVEGDVCPKDSGATLFLRDISERKRAVLALEKREEDLQRILDNVPAIVSYVDRDLRLQRLSKGYEAVFGRSSREAIGKHLSEVAGEPHFQIALPYAERALRGESVAFESRVRHRDGTLHNVYVTYTPQRGGNGGWDGFIAMVQDISERKRIESDLEKARGQAAVILESVTDAFFALDRRWRFTYINQEAQRLLQRTRESLIGKNVWEEFAPAVGSEFDRQYHLAMEQNCPVRFEAFYPPLGLWLEVRGYPSADGLAIYFQDINERKQAEVERERLLRELDTERARLRAIFESVPAGIVFAEAPSGCITYGNRQLEDILRHPVLRSKSVDDYREWVAFHPDGRQVEAHEWALARCLAGETVRGDEVLYQRGDGTRAWIRVSGVPIRDREGAVTGSVVAVYDVDLEHRAAEALAERERELATLLDSIPDVISRYGRDLRFLLTSAAVQRHTGRPPEWFPGKSNQDLGAPDDLAHRWDESLRSVFETGQPDRIEFDFEGPLGLRHYLSTALPELAGDGTVGSVLTITHDNTDRKRALQALRESEQRLRIAIETARLGAWQLDLGTKALEASAQCKANFGRLAGEAFGYGELLQAVHPQDAASFQSCVERAIEERTDYRAEHRVCWPDGSLHWLISSGRALYSDSGAAVRLVGVTLDTTERKQAEEALTRQAEELARSNADLQQFAYVTSHDLQEPLRTITSFAQMLTMRYSGKLDQEADEFLAFIVSGAKRMKGLIDALLAYSRVVNTEAAPHGPVDLDAALHWAKMNLQAVIEESGAVVVNGELPTVQADQVQIVQLFQNLLSNAIKYRKADRTAEVGIEARRDEGDWVVEVRDNGIGIDPQHAERIFGVFKRLHGKDVPGTGIGLAICKRIVEKHGGRIWVESQEGAGARFCFTLPG